MARIWEEQIEFYEAKMQERQNQALTKLGLFLKHPANLKKMAAVLSYAWYEEAQDAKNIAENINFSIEDFLAIDEDIYSLKEFLDKEVENLDAQEKYYGTY